MPIKPYSGAFGNPELIHLLRRTIFGVSPSDMKAFNGLTLDQAVDKLLTFNGTESTVPLRAYKGADKTIDVNIPFGTTWTGIKYNNSESNPDGFRRASYKQWWAMLMSRQERNLREKLVLFWHNHLVTDTNNVVSIAELAYRYNKLLRSSCIGNFRTLMYNITVEPAMLRYLNGEKNSSSAPDENYGRELQELFCMGKGPDSKYTEADVKAAARVLTGWTINYNSDYPAEFKIGRHDTKDKQFSDFYGNKVIKGINTANAGADELNALLDMMFSNTELARFIVRKLFRFFVYYDITTDVENEFIIPLADQFRAGNYEIKPLLKSFFTSEYFFKAAYRGAMIKSAVDYVVGMTRQLEMTWPNDPNAFEARYYFANIINNMTLAQGQDVGDPPNVAGWPAYYESPAYHEFWLDTATYPARLSTISGFVTNGYSTGTGSTWIYNESKGKTFKMDGPAFISKLSNPSDPNILINDLIFFLFGVEVSQKVKDSIKTTYLLKGQTTDYYWTDAYNSYIANPANPAGDGKGVPKQLQDLIAYLFSAAEYHLH